MSTLIQDGRRDDCKVAEAPKVLYVCDGKQCDKPCHEECKHTTYIEHAVNFEQVFGCYVERQAIKARGVWCYDGDINGKPIYSCTNCGDSELVRTPYCPLCGAKMENEVEK